MTVDGSAREFTPWGYALVGGSQQLSQYGSVAPLEDRSTFAKTAS